MNKQLTNAELIAARKANEELQRKLFAKGSPYVGKYVKWLDSVHQKGGK